MLRCDMIPYNYSPIAYGSLYVIALCVWHIEFIVLSGKVIMDASIFYEKFPEYRWRWWGLHSKHKQCNFIEKYFLKLHDIIVFV